jgi:hypothetical protein
MTRSRLLLWLRGELGQTPAKRHVVTLESGEKRAMTVAQFAEEVVRSVNTSLGKPLEQMNEGDVQTAVGLGQLHCIVPGCKFRAMAYSKAADPNGRVRFLPVCVNHGEWLIHEAPRYLSEKYGRPVEAKVEQFTEPAPWDKELDALAELEAARAQLEPGRCDACGRTDQPVKQVSPFDQRRICRSCFDTELEQHRTQSKADAERVTRDEAEDGYAPHDRDDQ